MSLSPRPSKIVCVGRNYPAHARELGNEPPAEPLIFLKPPSALLDDGETILLPTGAGRVDYEGEIGVIIGLGGRHIRESEALSHVAAIVPVNDVTARDLQKSDGQWTRAKGFDTFCPVGEPVALEDVSLDSLRIETRLNGELVQEAALADAIFSVAYLIHFISRVMTLEPGDLIATGTPHGVGAILPWDEVEVTIPGVGSVRNPARTAPDAPWPYTMGGL